MDPKLKRPYGTSHPIFPEDDLHTLAVSLEPD